MKNNSPILCKTLTRIKNTNEDGEHETIGAGVKIRLPKKMFDELLSVGAVEEVVSEAEPEIEAKPENEAEPENEAKPEKEAGPEKEGK